jgi:nodulation protein E
VRGYSHQGYFDDRRADFIDRFAQFAVIAAREAVADAGVEWTPELRETAAIITGSCVGGQSTEDIGFHDVYKLGHNRVHPLTIPKTMANAGASHISMEFGITGPSFTISTACSSAGHAIGQAFWMVRSGMTDLALAGGSEAPFSFGILKAWEAMRVVSPETCRPFSKDRRGMMLGEGAAMLVLEPLEAALARGARIHAEIVGFGMSADACHITQPSAEGAAKAMRAALRDAGLAPEADRLRQRPRHRHAGQRSHRNRGHPQPCSARTPASWRSAPPNRCTATRWAPPRRWNASPPCWRCATACCRPPPITTLPDPECDLDVIPNQARQRRWNMRSRIRSPSAA